MRHTVNPTPAECASTNDAAETENCSASLRYCAYTIVLKYELQNEAGAYSKSQLFFADSSAKRGKEKKSKRHASCAQELKRTSIRSKVRGIVAKACQGTNHFQRTILYCN